MTRSRSTLPGQGTPGDGSYKVTFHLSWLVVVHSACVFVPSGCPGWRTHGRVGARLDRFLLAKRAFVFLKDHNLKKGDLDLSGYIIVYIYIERENL